MGGRIQGRRAARMARIYHYRVRDGQAVAWCEGDGRVRLMAPVERTVERQWVAVEVLADVVGRPRAARHAAEFAAWIDAMGDRWDVTEGAVWDWIAGRSTHGA